MKKIKKFLVSALIGAVVWTLALTPYVLLVTKMGVLQYLSWVVMEFVLVPPIAPIVFWLTEKALKTKKELLE